MGQSSAPMQRYISFLRAINVGGHTVKMNQQAAAASITSCASAISLPPAEQDASN